MHKFCLTIVLMLTMICHGSNAQEINQFTYSHLGMADGMHSQRVYSILQTMKMIIPVVTKITYE